MFSLNLSTLAIGLGLLHAVPNIYGALKPAGFAAAARKFPRYTPIGYVLMLAATAWFVYYVSLETVSDFAHMKRFLYVFFAAVGIGAAATAGAGVGYALSQRGRGWSIPVCLAIVALVAVNVLLRYALSLGSVWAQELEWHLLAPLILFGMSYALLHGEHVRVDVLYAGFSARKKLYVDMLSALLSIAVSVIIIVLSLRYVQQSWVINEQSADPGGLPYRWLLKSLIPIGFILLILQSVALLLGTVEKLKALRK